MNKTQTQLNQREKEQSNTKGKINQPEPTPKKQCITTQEHKQKPKQPNPTVASRETANLPRGERQGMNEISEVEVVLQSLDQL